MDFFLPMYYRILPLANTTGPIMIAGPLYSKLDLYFNRPHD